MTATEVLREWFFARRINTSARRTPERQRSIATDGREKQATVTFCEYPWLALRILSVNIRVNPWLEIQN